MLYRCILPVCILLAAAGSPAAAQEGRIIVEKADASKELKRSAHQLHIPKDRLQKIRDLLQESTDLARGMDPMPAQQLSLLGSYWVQFYKSRAAANLESMIATVQRAGQQAASIGDYQQAGAVFQSLLQTLATLDFDKAIQQARQWPDPPKALGDDATKLRDQSKRMYLQSLIQQLMYRDPRKAASMYAELGPPTPSNYSTTAQLALQLARSGQKDRALSLVDSVVADYKSLNPDPNTSQQFTYFLQQVANLDPDRFMAGLTLLTKLSPPESPDSVVVTIGDQSLSLSQSEMSMLNMLRGITSSPELLLKALDAMPVLRDKVDQIGGIDEFLSPAAAVSYSSVSFGPYMNRNVRFAYMSPPPPPVHFATLFEELKGKAATNPALVRRKLSEAAKNPDGINTLINLAQQAWYEDPDLSSVALEMAAAMLPEVQPLERRATTLQNLVSAYRNCEGDVPAGLLKDGFVLADQVRQEYEEKNPQVATQRVTYTVADSLEQALIAEVAVDHFDAAMQYLRAKPNDEKKLAAYLRVIESLRQNIY